MDTEEELGRLKWLLIGGLVFLVSGCFSYGEMKYKMGGSDATATVTSVRDIEERGRRGRIREKRIIEYVFKDSSGQQRKAQDKVDRDVDARPSQSIAIEYTDSGARIKGNDNMFWVYVFLASVAFVVFKIFMIWKASKA